MSLILLYDHFLMKKKKKKADKETKNLIDTKPLNL